MNARTFICARGYRVTVFSGSDEAYADALAVYGELGKSAPRKITK